MTDIPIEQAMVCWCETKQIVKVVHHPDVKGLAANCPNSAGASRWDWKQLTANDRLTQLLTIGYEMTITYGIDLKIAHEAFKVIPEYRQAVMNDNGRVEAYRA